MQLSMYHTLIKAIEMLPQYICDCLSNNSSFVFRVLKAWSYIVKEMQVFLKCLCLTVGFGFAL